METQNKLSTFGITSSELPITNTGKVKTRHHQQWIKSRVAIDMGRMKVLEECFHRKMQQQQYRQQHGAAVVGDLSSMLPTYDEYLLFKGDEPIIHPMTNDVLFCKGGNVKNVNHYGTIEFANLVECALMEHVIGIPAEDRIKRRESIIQEIIDEVKSHGGRFLTLDKKSSTGGCCCWVEIKSSPDLHNRVSTSLYDHKRRLKGKVKTRMAKHRRSASSAMLMENAASYSNPSLFKRCKVGNYNGKRRTPASGSSSMLWGGSGMTGNNGGSSPMN